MRYSGGDARFGGFFGHHHLVISAALHKLGQVVVAGQVKEDGIQDSHGGGDGKERHKNVNGPRSGRVASKRGTVVSGDNDTSDVETRRKGKEAKGVKGHSNSKDGHGGRLGGASVLTSGPFVFRVLEHGIVNVVEHHKGGAKPVEPVALGANGHIGDGGGNSIEGPQNASGSSVASKLKDSVNDGRNDSDAQAGDHGPRQLGIHIGAELGLLGPQLGDIEHNGSHQSHENGADKGVACYRQSVELGSHEHPSIDQAAHKDKDHDSRRTPNARGIGGIVERSP